MRQMKLVCVGNGMCVATAPKVFVTDANGQSVAAAPEAANLEQVLEAAASCPVGAIVVTVEFRMGRPRP